MRPIAPRLPDCEEFSVAEEQEEFKPLTAARIVYQNGAVQMCCRWTLTPEERQRVIEGDDVYIQFPNHVYPHHVGLRPDWAR